jgi:tetrapyrrole methylase family protein/MazG family protein
MQLWSLIEPALNVLDIQPRALQVAHLDALVERYYPNLSVDRPALIGPLTCASHCRRLCDLLRQAYPATHTVKIVTGLADARAMTQALALDELGAASVDQGPALLYLPQLNRTGAVETFQGTVAHLRAPDGCPWDRQQTHRSLRQEFQEEAYEVLDALDRDDLESLKEELGDVLLLVLMQAQIASEAGEFQMNDIVHHIHAKIVRRHPHVFADLVVNDVDEVLVNWEEIKQREKGQNSKRSVLDSVARAMPSLSRAQSIQRHIDWMEEINVDTETLLAQITARAAALKALASKSERQTCIGELLFEISNLARKWHIDAESILREANNRFEQYFRHWEVEHSKSQGDGN